MKNSWKKNNNKHDIVSRMMSRNRLSRMMQIRNYIVLICAVLTVLGSLYPGVKADDSVNPIFQEGEELVFKVSWMGIVAGTITMTIEDYGQYNNKPALKATIIGKTSEMFSRFFKVKDVITSIFSEEQIISYHYEKNIREGKYRKIRTVTFNQEEHIAFTQDKQFDILPESRDPVACIFALRSMPLNIASTIKMNANSNGKNYPIEIRLVHREMIETPNGNMRAIKCEPLPSWEGRVFERDRSEVILWLSDDKYRVPLKICTKVKIGSIKAVLIARKGPGWEIDRI